MARRPLLLEEARIVPEHQGVHCYLITAITALPVSTAGGTPANDDR